MAEPGFEPRQSGFGVCVLNHNTVFVEGCHGGNVSRTWPTPLPPAQPDPTLPPHGCTHHAPSPRHFSRSTHCSTAPGHLFPAWSPLPQGGLISAWPDVRVCPPPSYALASRRIPHGEPCAWPTAATPGASVERQGSLGRTLTVRISGVCGIQKSPDSCPPGRENLAVSEEDSASSSPWQGAQASKWCPWVFVTRWFTLARASGRTTVTHFSLEVWVCAHIGNNRDIGGRAALSTAGHGCP